MSTNPRGWLRVPIGALCTLENGRAFKPSEWVQTGLPIVRIQNLNNPAASFNRYGGVFSDRYYLRGGELLFAWSGTPGTSFGAHIWRGGEALLNQHIFRVDFNPAVLDKRFFRYAINQKLNELIDVAHGGVGLRHVTKGKFEATEVAIAPLNEQERIAVKLDAVLARVEACRERLDRVPAILKRFRQAVLATASSGELTAEWRVSIGKPDLAWKCVSVGAVAETVFDGPFGSHLKSADYSAFGVQVVRLENIGPLKFITEKKTYIPQEKYDSLRRHTLKPNDLLFSSFVDEEVRVCLLPENLPVAAINKADVFCVRPNTSVCLPRFLLYRLGCSLTYLALREEVHGATRPRINLAQLRTIEISLPPVEEQKEIIRRVESLLAWADRVEARVTAAREQANRLTPALLAKAFRGELVPQNPADEPAAELLTRVLQSKTNAEAGLSRRRRRPAIIE